MDNEKLRSISINALFGYLGGFLGNLLIGILIYVVSSMSLEVPSLDVFFWILFPFNIATSFIYQMIFLVVVLAGGIISAYENNELWRGMLGGLIAYILALIISMVISIYSLPS